MQESSKADTKPKMPAFGKYKQAVWKSDCKILSLGICQMNHPTKVTK